MADETTASGESIQFEYQYPYVDTGSDSRTVEHEPIGEETVVQHMGASAQEITLQGHCYRDEANDIDNLTENGLIRLLCDRWQGIAIVTKTETNATGNGGGARSGVENRIYDYRITCVEVDGRAPG